MKKLLNIEKKCINFFKEHYLLLGFFIITLLAIFLRISELNFKSDDYIAFLSPWFDYLKNNGGLHSLATYSGDYNAPYVTIIALLTYLPFNKLYLIKIVSIFFDFTLAFASAYLVYYLVPKNKKEYSLLTYSLILFSPIVFLNSALWGQCDSGYATFIVLALLYLFKEKYVKSFIFLGIAFSLKLQFIFIIPVFIILYISKQKFSILHFLIIPIVNFILCLPAIIFGRPIKDVLLVYFNQTKTYSKYLSLNIPNIYTIVQGTPDIFYRVGFIFTIFICVLMLGYVIYKKVKWDPEKIINTSIWFIVIVTFLLPGMHDRYLYVAEILAIISLIVYKKNLLITASLIINALIVYSGYLFKVEPFKLPYVTIVYLIVIIIYTKNTIKQLSE